MRTCSAVSIVAALTATAVARADYTVVEAGTVLNTEPGSIQYQGDFGAYVSSFAVGEATQIELDVSGILAEFSGFALAGVRLVDTGENQYGVNSAGADIDLFSFSGVPDGIDWTFSYLGPTGAHQNESSEDLATRVATIDAQSGVHEWTGMFHVSLGQTGMLTAMLSAPTGGTDVTQPPLAGNGLRLHLAEAGSGESFRIQLLMSVPTPGALPLVGLAAIVGPSRRRRSPRPA
ncbi:MAG: hypothetical protein ACYTJ0_08245 [Planctomycetota bacterium]|jgi:hypothetical protein